MSKKWELPDNLATPLAVILGAIIIAGAVWFSGGKIPSPANGNHAVGVQPVVAVDSSKVITAGEPFIGQADAPLTIAYWYDYQCPFCHQNEETVMGPLIQDYVNTGKVRIIFKDNAFLGPDSIKLALLSRAVWEIAPDKFYAWHKAIFDHQGQENSGWATDGLVLSLSSDVLGTSTAEQVVLQAAKKSSTYQVMIDADRNEAQSLGISGTPALIIGHTLVPGALPYAQIKADVEAALAGK